MFVFDDFGKVLVNVLVKVMCEVLGSIFFMVLCGVEKEV